MNEDKKDNAEWARLIYRNHIDGIEAVKRRQWAATNYILLISLCANDSETLPPQ